MRSPKTRGPRACEPESLTETLDMRRRPGITLIEVLVAIFIMAIGLLALLTLFPLGALRMAQSLQDDRTASAASEAANVCDAFGIRRRTPQLFRPQPAPCRCWPRRASSKPAKPAAAAFRCMSIPMVSTMRPAPLGASGVDDATPRPASARGRPSVIPAALRDRDPAPRFNCRTRAMAARVTSRCRTTSRSLQRRPAGHRPRGTLPRGGRYTWAYLLHRLQPVSPARTWISRSSSTRAGRPRCRAARTTYVGQPATPNDTSVSLILRRRRRRTSVAAPGFSTRATKPHVAGSLHRCRAWRLLPRRLRDARWDDTR